MQLISIAPIIAILISLGSLWLSVRTSIEQKRQWRASLSSVSLNDASFIYWRTMATDQAKNAQLGICA